jgi:nucleoside 2-deoxyribosyltransferase
MTEEIKLLNIGLVMPIAPIDGCSTDHWLDVKRIITESVSSMPGYSSEPKIVSEGNSSGLIHKRIVEGLYKSDIIICDVSCKNPNVMFELGMRLAFDKPTIIIKDDKTDYTFDAGVIEHLQYPRDLRYKSIVKFKELLAEKVQATYEETQQDGNKSSFLKSFGNIQVASMNEEIVSTDQYIINSLQEIQNEMAFLKSSMNPVKNMATDEVINSQTRLQRMVDISINLYFEKKGLSYNQIDQIDLPELSNFVRAELRNMGVDTFNENMVTKFITRHLNDKLRILKNLKD